MTARARTGPPAYGVAYDPIRGATALLRERGRIVTVTAGNARRGYATIDQPDGGDLAAQRRPSAAASARRPPLDWDGIGAVLQALAEGFGLRHKVDPAMAPPSAESAFELYAVAAAAVLAVLTRPAGDDSATAHEAIRSLLNAATPNPA